MADGGSRRTLRWATVVLVVGAVMLAAAVALLVWDAAGSDPAPVVITGRN